jgi:DNA-binding MarR family transcriptional regulator
MNAGQNLSNETVLYHQAVADQFGLNATDTKTANILRSMGPTHAGIIASKVGLTTGGATLVINRLERAGFVRRVADPKDHRKVLVEIIPSKLPEADRIYQPMGEAFAQFVTKYSDTELELLYDYFDNAARILHEESLKIRHRP